MQNNQTPALPVIQNNDNLPIIHVDGASIHSRKDGMFYIRLTVHLPDAIHEQARVMISDAHLHDLINVMCNITDYYPEKNTDKK